MNHVSLKGFPGASVKDTSSLHAAAKVVEKGENNETKKEWFSNLWNRFISDEQPKGEGENVATGKLKATDEGTHSDKTLAITFPGASALFRGMASKQEFDVTISTNDEATVETETWPVTVLGHHQAKNSETKPLDQNQSTQIEQDGDNRLDLSTGAPVNDGTLADLAESGEAIKENNEEERVHSDESDGLTTTPKETSGDKQKETTGASTDKEEVNEKTESDLTGVGSIVPGLLPEELEEDAEAVANKLGENENKLDKKINGSIVPGLLPEELEENAEAVANKLGENENKLDEKINGSIVPGLLPEELEEVEKGTNDRDEYANKTFSGLTGSTGVSDGTQSAEKAEEKVVHDVRSAGKEAHSESDDKKDRHGQTVNKNNVTKESKPDPVVASETKTNTGDVFQHSAKEGKETVQEQGRVASVSHSGTADTQQTATPKDQNLEPLQRNDRSMAQVDVSNQKENQSGNNNRPLYQPQSNVTLPEQNAKMREEHQASNGSVNHGIKVDESTDNSLRFSAMTKELARRLEQAVHSGKAAYSENSEPITEKIERQADVISSSLDSHDKVEESNRLVETGIADRAARHELRIENRPDIRELPRVPVLVGSGIMSFEPVLAQTATLSGAWTGSGFNDMVQAPLEEEYLWEKFSADFDKSQQKESEQEQQMSLSRLSQSPIMNSDIRRELVPMMAKWVQNLPSAGKNRSDLWQNHRFTMDDGRKFQVSVKETDGVLKLKIGSANIELARLFQQYQNEIRDHLEKECHIQIELELDQRDMDGFGSFFGDKSEEKNKDGLKFDKEKKTKQYRIDKIIPQAARLFGYNQMEWTI